MLKAENVTVRYGARTVVQDLSFELKEGEWLMLVGPNGAGKSTLIEAIAGGVPYAGKITLAGWNIRAFRASELARRIGVLAQKNAVSYAYSVEEVVSLGRYAHASGFLASRDDDGGERVERALELTGLTELRRRQRADALRRRIAAHVSGAGVRPESADSHSRRTGEPPRSDLSEAHFFAD